MISLFRNFAKSKWAAGLFVLLIISFVVVGAQTDVFGSLGPKHVITAGERSVDQVEFRRDFDRVRANLEQEAQRPVTIQDLIAENIHIRYLDSQTTRLGFLAWAWDAGIRPGKELVLKQIRQAPAFFNQITGAFDEQAYRTALAQQNVTPAMLEQEFRDQYATNHYAAALFAGARAPRIFGALVAGQALEARDGRWFSVTQAMVGAVPAPTDAQLTAFLSENAAQLRQPEYRMASVVLFNDGAAPSTPVTEERILERFNFRKDALSQPEKRTFVTLTAPSKAVADRMAAALRAGQSPAAVGQANNIQPSAYDETPRTALGDPAIAAAVFGLAGGQVSDPIQGRVGFTVAQVSTIIPGQQATLTGVRDALVEELRTEDARAQVYTRVENYEKARDAGKTLAAAAQEVGARIIQLPPFTQDGKLPNRQPLNAPPQIFASAYALSKGGESEVVDAGQGQYFVLRLDDIRPAALPTLAEVRAPLAQQWTLRENSRRLSARAEELAGQIRGGRDIAAVASAAGATLTTRSGVQQNQTAITELGQGLVEGLFGQGRGQVFVEPASATSFIVGRVDQIRAPTPVLAAPIAEQVRPRMTQDMVQAIVETGFKAAAARIKTRYDVALALQALGISEPTTPASGAPATPAPAQ